MLRDGVEVLGVGLVVGMDGVELMVLVVVVAAVVEVVVVARRCLPRTRSAFLLSLTSLWCWSMASDSPGLPNLSLMSRLRNTGVSGGGHHLDVWSDISKPRAPHVILQAVVG